MIPYKDNSDIPAIDFYFFKVCNSVPRFHNLRHSIYELKNKILNKYGVNNGSYDLQIIKRKCHNCNGTGKRWNGEDCFRCSNGVYRIDYVALKRYTLNGELFHNPLDNVSSTGVLTIFENGKVEKRQLYFANTIHGLIEKPKPKISIEFAYLWLLYSYDVDKFYPALKSYRQGIKGKAVYKFNNCIKNLPIMKGLSNYFGVKEIEDNSLPF